MHIPIVRLSGLAMWKMEINTIKKQAGFFSRARNVLMKRYELELGQWTAFNHLVSRRCGS